MSDAIVTVGNYLMARVSIMAPSGHPIAEHQYIHLGPRKAGYASIVGSTFKTTQ